MSRDRRTRAGAPRWSRRIFKAPAFAPILVLIGFSLFFSFATSTFSAVGNLSLILQQSVITGTLALGQTMIILTAGIDLADGGIAVMGTIVAGSLANGGVSGLASLLFTLALCMGVGAIAGLLVSRVRLPPFIVTLGLLGIVTAATRLISRGGAFPVSDDLLTWTGNGLSLGGASTTYGVLIMLALYVFGWIVLTQTAWGRHVYAIGNDAEAARLVGIPVENTLLAVYGLAGLLYGIAAWLALGRIPNADPNALQTANLDTITAVVIGGTSLFGGRGSIVGALVGTLIVTVLRNGLTLMSIDPLWQDLVTGVLVIAAVAVDRFSRGTRR